MTENFMQISDSAIKRIREIKTKKDNQDKFLRITVDSGGCNGFQYLFDMDSVKKNDDIAVFYDQDFSLIITDDVSKQFLEGCKLDFINELGGSYFKIDNPNASSKCGCGSSFSV